MAIRLALISAATALVSVGAFAQDPGVGAADAQVDQSLTPDKLLFLEACAARKFETTAEVEVEGKKRGRKVTLCGKVGQSDADWVATLEDAAKKFENNATFRPAVRDQIIADIKAEIARVEARAASDTPRGGPAPLTDLRSGYSTLPAIPDPAPVVVQPSPTAPAAALATALPPADRADYSTLPPLPAPLKMASKASPAATAAAPKKPLLTIRCLAPGEKGGGSRCDFLEPTTRLAILADEDLAGDLTLRFLRKGDDRGELALAQMRQGQILRAKLPSQLCAGVATSKVEIQVLGGNSRQVLNTYGPYGLRC